MNLYAVVRGDSRAELLANADAICRQFFGAEPYEVIINSYDYASAEAKDSGGVGFQFSMNAVRKVQ